MVSHYSKIHSLYHSNYWNTNLIFVLVSIYHYSMYCMYLCQQKMIEHNQLPCENVTKQTAQSVEMTKAKQADHNILVFPIGKSHLTTVVLFVIIPIIIALLLQSYTATTDHNIHFTELLEKVKNEEIVTEIDQEM